MKKMRREQKTLKNLKMNAGVVWGLGREITRDNRSQSHDYQVLRLFNLSMKCSVSYQSASDGTKLILIIRYCGKL